MTMHVNLSSALTASLESESTATMFSKYIALQARQLHGRGLAKVQR